MTGKERRDRMGQDPDGAGFSASLDDGLLGLEDRVWARVDRRERRSVLARGSLQALMFVGIFAGSFNFAASRSDSSHQYASLASALSQDDEMLARTAR